MEQIKTLTKNKGGRPKKPVKKDQLLGVKCSQDERKMIEEKASLVNLSVSEYLREMGLTGKIDRYEKHIPGEVLQLTGTLNHMAANLNQIAKKRNSNDELNMLERAQLMSLSDFVKTVAKDIKNFLE